MKSKHLDSLSVITNPAKNYLLLKSIIDITSEFYYTILDMKGNEIVCSRIHNIYGKLVSISIDFLKSGMYLLKLVVGDNYVVRSFVKV